MDPIEKRTPLSAEHARLEDSSLDTPGNWKAIGPYISERAWGTVREDYSADGQAWQYFPHEHARSRAYRWNEDGLAGLCDRAQRLCFALAFWNGRDPFLKERIFGLSGPEGNHGEDAKEYWWYIDATPTSSWLRWRYHYPQAAFPYALLRQENAKRNKADPEFELADTGVFEGDRYWQITADYAKASPDDVCMRISVRNAGPDPAELHVLPTLWFRNRWSWEVGIARPIIRATANDGGVGAVADEELLGRWRLIAGTDPAGKPPSLLFCENETNVRYLYGVTDEQTPYPKDGINDHVIHGAPTVNPAGHGTKMACWYHLVVAPGETIELKLRLARVRPGTIPNLGADFARTLADRSREADEYYVTHIPDGASDDEAQVMRQAFAGMVWSQQFYHYDVARWLDGDIIRPPEPRKSGRNAGWRHLNNHDVIAMPDKWEYPWYASWDLAFHCVVLAQIDPSAAKHQMLLLAREWFMHPNGQLPAYEWNFGDVNPPIQAWATLAVFHIDGGTDFDFLSRAFQKLLINFTWWVNRKDARGDNVFEGGFLGLDNIGPFDRSQMLPDGDVLEQSDGTAWMAKFCLNMLEMALRLANHQPTYEDVAVKFFEHFALIADAMGKLWDEQDGFFYDRLRKRDGSTFTVRARSVVGLLPIFAAVQLDASLWERLPMFRKRARWYVQNKPGVAEFLHMLPDDERPWLISLVGKSRLRQVLARMLDESEFLSPYGLRSLSRYHREHPLIINMDGHVARLDYEPGESRSGLFGGNSNWRGPIWFPLNFVAIESLRHLHISFGEDFTVDLPTGSGRQANLEQVAEELERRLLNLFLRNADGWRPALGSNPRFQRDPAWCDSLLFYEYFHGDTGEGLGASHQTGWTALAGALVANRRSRSNRKSQGSEETAPTTDANENSNRIGAGCQEEMMAKALSDKERALLDAYWRAANYLSVGQIYLYDNPLLKQPLTKEHIKPRLLGHWGTTPGLNFIYVHLNRVIKKHDLDMIYITGPGHGGPGLVANAYLEGTYSEVYPNVSPDEQGMKRLFTQFSFPGGIPSHVAPETPGSIHEGGELGYSLSHAYGAAFDNPDLIVACIVGDGEAETGALATSWHSNKFLNPATDGVVLPILHLNGYKIANPCILARISHEELDQLFRGYGYTPYFVEGDEPEAMHELMAATLDKIVGEIQLIKANARRNRSTERPRWPMIILRSPKGWTCPKEIDGKRTEGFWRSHQVPMGEMQENPAHVRILEQWMNSYRPTELFDDSGRLRPELADLAPRGARRMSANPHANGGLLLRELRMPNFGDYAVEVSRPGAVMAESTRIMGRFLRDVMKLNMEQRNFRLFSPDENNSNRWQDVLEVTNRAWLAETYSWDDHLAPDGRVMEMLSEHQCQGWLEGYLLTGRHGFFSCYEAFIHIVDSMFNQHAKWLKVCNRIPWRRPIASLNYLLSSHVWRQDHNGFSHQDPGFIDHVVNKKAEVIRVYLPPDANCLLSVTDHCLRSRNYVNVVVAGKQPAPQWLTMNEAIKHCEAGLGIWEWASNDKGSEPDVVMACCGDVPTLETLAAVDLLRKYAPDLKVRVINVVNLMKLQPPSEHPHGLSDHDFDALFTTDKPIIFAFHGYPWLVHRLTYRRTGHDNLHVRGYREEGTTTTPFDMCVLNDLDRFHLVADVIDRVPKLGSRAAYAKQAIRDKLIDHKTFICRYGDDMPEITGWRWGQEAASVAVRSTEAHNV